MVLPFAAVASAVLLGLLAGCGSTAPSLLDGAARKDLHADVAAIRSAGTDAADLTTAVTRFRTDVRRLLADGALDAADAAVLLVQVDQIERRAAADAPTATPTPTPAADKVTAPAAPRGKEKPGKAPKPPRKKHGHG